MFDLTNPFRSSLPHDPPKDIRFQAWKLDTSPNAPQLSLTNLPTLNMDGTSLSRPRSTSSSPVLLASRPTSALGTNDPTAPPTIQHQTPGPNRLQRRRNSNAPRKSSNGTNPHPTSTFSPATTDGASPGLNNPLSSPTADDGVSEQDGNSPWCGAVGRATLGKSGRVIERLMAEIDKLKRELNAEISHRQEIEKREEVNSRAIGALKAENANLEQAKEVDAAVLKRRDRRIEDLKAELESERTRRVTLEEEKREAETARDEAAARERKEVGEAREIAKHATSHAEVLESSHRQLAAEYRQRTETFTRDLSRLTEDRDEEKCKVQRLGIVVEQLKHETERTNKLNTLMTEAFDAYKEGAESRISEMEEAARRHEDEEATLRAETKRVVGEARWLINIGKNASKRSEYLPLEEYELGS